MTDEWLTTKEVAARMHVSPKTVRDWAHTGKLKVLRVGNAIRINETSFKAFVERMTEHDHQF